MNGRCQDSKVDGRRVQAGFSLLELLVAVSILALAIVPILVHQTTATRNTGRLQEKTLAWLVAGNVVNQLTAQRSLTPGPVSGEQQQGGLVFPWRGRVELQKESGMVMVSVDVLHPARDAVLSTLTGFRSQQ